MPRSLCLLCRHFSWGAVEAHCEAFPEGIPVSIWNGAPHFAAIGDEDIVFEPDDGVSNDEITEWREAHHDAGDDVVVTGTAPELVYGGSHSPFFMHRGFAEELAAAWRAIAETRTWGELRQRLPEGFVDLAEFEYREAMGQGFVDWYEMENAGLIVDGKPKLTDAADVTPLARWWEEPEYNPKWPHPGTEDSFRQTMSGMPPLAQEALEHLERRGVVDVWFTGDGNFVNFGDPDRVARALTEGGVVIVRDDDLVNAASGPHG